MIYIYFIGYKFQHMESSTNLHLHEIEGSDSSQVQTSSSCFRVGNNDHASSHWNKSSNFLMESSSNIHASGCEDPTLENNPMVQELSFANWPNNDINTSSFPHLIPNIKIKQEPLSSNHHHINLDDNYSSFQKLCDLLKNPSINSLSPSDDQMLLLKTHMLTNDYHHNNSNFPNLLDENKELVTNFSHIFPSANISNLINDDSNSNNMASSFSLSSNSSTLEMNDLQRGSNNRFGPARSVSEGSEINQPPPSSHLIELLNGSSTFDVDHNHRQKPSDLSLWNCSNNLLSFNNNNNNGVQETKGSSCIVEHNKSTMSKKARLEASCPPLKVRKEKLGDRIAALQQLVAPFGKTDTASVLMEAIGYIKFLQNQVETLSVPYMKLSRNKNNITQRVSDDQNRDEEPKQDLRSGGLCLVPVSCMSYLASDADNGGAWLPSNFNPSF